MALLDIRSRKLAAFLLLVALVAIAGTGILRELLMLPGESPGYFWPLLGLGIGLALSVETRYWIWLALLFIALDAPYASPDNYQFEHPVALAAEYLSFFGVVFAACWIMRRRYPDGLNLSQLNPDLRDFLIFAGLLALTTGVMDPLYGTLASDRPLSLHDWNHWLALDLMSIVVAAPLFLAWSWGPVGSRKLADKASIAELILLVATLGTILALGLYGPPTATRTNFDLVWAPVLWAIFRFDLRVLTLIFIVTTSYVTLNLSIDPDVRSHLEEGWSEVSLITTTYVGLSVSVAMIINALIARVRLQNAELSQTKEYLDRLVQATGSFFWVYDVGDRRFTHFSSRPTGQWTDILDMRGATTAWLEHVHPADRERIRVLWERLLDGEIGKPFDVTYRLIHDDYETRWDHQIGIPIRDDQGKVERYVGMIFDITDRQELQLEQQRLEQIVYESDKLNTVGALAAGLAHDWNNLLLVLSMESSRLKEHPDPDSWLTDNVRVLDQVVDEGRATTEQLLSLARRGQEPAVVSNLHAEVRRATDLLSRVLPANVSLQTNYVLDKAFNVRCKVSHLHQIVINLGLNARDAIGEAAGTIHVEVSGPSEENLHGSLTDVATLKFVDDGCGMTPETIDRIFEPLFTTRQDSGGTGLGMSIVASFVTEMGGRVTVDSSPGSGTTVLLLMPVVLEAQ